MRDVVQCRAGGFFGFGCSLKTFRHGQTAMDQSGSFRWLVASDPGTKATVGEMAIADRTCSVSGTTVEARATAASSRSPHSAAEASARVEDVKVATVHGSRREGFGRQGTGGQLGESIGSHGGDRRFRGRHHPGSFGTCQEGSSNSTGRDTDLRLRTISGQSSSTFGGNRCPESHGCGQHRGRHQEIGIS